MSKPLKMLWKVEWISSLWWCCKENFFLFHIDFNFIKLGTDSVWIDFDFVNIEHIYKAWLYVKMSLTKLSIEWLINCILNLQELSTLFYLCTSLLIIPLNIIYFSWTFLRSRIRSFSYQSITLNHFIFFHVVFN